MTSSSPSGRRRSRMSNPTCARSAPPSTTCCRCCARPRADPALDDRPGHHRVRRRLPGEAPRAARRRGRVRRPCARADRRRQVPAGDHVASVHRRRRRREFHRAHRQPLQRLRRADREDLAGSGRAGQDLDQHPALRHLRAPQPADDGLRELRGQRVRGHRPDQPRLSRAAASPCRDDRRHVPAQGLRLLRGAFHAPGMLLAVSRVNEGVPLFLVEGIKRPSAASLAQGRGARPDLQARHRRRARLAPPSSSACSSASWPTSRSAIPTRARPTQSWPTRSARDGSREPTTPSSRHPEDAARDPRARLRATACWPTRGTPSAPARCSASPPRRRRCSGNWRASTRRRTPAH